MLNEKCVNCAGKKACDLMQEIVDMEKKYIAAFEAESADLMRQVREMEAAHKAKFREEALPLQEQIAEEVRNLIDSPHDIGVIVDILAISVTKGMQSTVGPMILDLSKETKVKRA